MPSKIALKLMNSKRNLPKLYEKQKLAQEPKELSNNVVKKLRSQEKEL